MNESSGLKPEEYVPELLFFAENLEFIKKNKKFFRKLQNRNNKHPQYNQVKSYFIAQRSYKY